MTLRPAYRLLTNGFLCSVYHFFSVKIICCHDIQHERYIRLWLFLSFLILFCVQFSMENTSDKEMEETNYVSENEEDTKAQNITSYGMKIDKSEIEAVHTAELASELKSLDVDVYEQQTFEASIVKQVDTQLAVKELGLQQDIIKHEIKGIENDIK